MNTQCLNSLDTKRVIFRYWWTDAVNSRPKIENLLLLLKYE